MITTDITTIMITTDITEPIMRDDIMIQLISLSQSCDNLFITYLCLYQALDRHNTGTRSECVFH